MYIHGISAHGILGMRSRQIYTYVYGQVIMLLQHILISDNQKVLEYIRQAYDVQPHQEE